MSVEVKMNEFNTISGNINALYHQAAKAFDMFDVDMDILYLIADLGEGCPQAELYKMTGMSKSTVNTAIKRMEKDGTLVLKASDGRSTDVYLTDKGRSLSEATVERLIRVENQIYDTWSAEDREAFLRLNRQYMELLQKGIEEL